VLKFSHEEGPPVDLYSLPATSYSSKNQFFYPFEILALLARKKSCSGENNILHLHWIEFLYRWGSHKYLIPFLVLPTICFLRFFKKMSGYKLTITLHNILPHKVFWPKIEFAFFRTMLRDVSDCIFVHSEVDKRAISEFYSIDLRKVEVIYHGLFRKPMFSEDIQKACARKKLGLPQNAVVFSFIGSISEYKGISVLMRAIEALFSSQDIPNIRFIISGEVNNRYLQYLQRNYSNIFNDKRVLLINKHLSENELDRSLKAADFGICPYINATTPATLLDFICYNLPIITTNDPKVMGIIKEIPTGYPLSIAKRGDPVSLRNAIVFAYTNSKQQQEKAKQIQGASKFINAWQISARRTLNSYSELVKVSQ
jgi:glycosyltransferase involved in cell wall biosynthesis